MKILAQSTEWVLQEEVNLRTHMPRGMAKKKKPQTTKGTFIFGGGVDSAIKDIDNSK